MILILNIQRMLKQIREIKFYLKPLRVYYLIIIQVDVNTIVSPSHYLPPLPYNIN